MNEIEFESISPFQYIAEAGDQYAWLLGQDADTFVGEFNTDQTLRGKISEFNVWNKPLPREEISKMNNCQAIIKGNIVSWRLNVVDNTGGIKSFIELDRFCSKHKIVVIAKRLRKRAAAEFCKIHGGAIFTPRSKEENNRMERMLAEKHSLCNSSAWLGIEANDTLQWLGQTNLYLKNHRSLFGTGNTLLKPAYFFNGTFCPMSFHDSSRRCFLCEFKKEPIYTLKGLCQSSQYSFNYYLQKVDSEWKYEGYKGGHIAIKSDGSWLLTKPGLDETGLFNNNGTLGSPLGRHLWIVEDYDCPDRRGQIHLTLSACSHGQFTCQSGTVTTNI